MSQESDGLNPEVEDSSIPTESGADESAAVCSFCSAPIEEAYYEINGMVGCATCQEEIAEGWDAEGTKFGRASRAVIAGSAAGGLGAGIYFAVAEISGYEVGLIALLVGLMVGAAVRWGGRGRGGWFYQSLAMFLTYVAIGASYFLFLSKAVAENPELFDPPDAAEISDENGAPRAEDAATQPAQTQPIEVDELDWSGMSGGEKAGTVVAVVVIVTVTVLALPIMVGFGSPIGLLLLGIALYEAWKINKRQLRVIEGPYVLESGGERAL